MGTLDPVDRYCPQDNELRNILLVHSRSVVDKVLWIADKHPELSPDITSLNGAAMLHDLGILLTHAPGTRCSGKKPYICHGCLGVELVCREGSLQHVLVCKRHTGVGPSPEEIIKQQFPIPHREMLPASIEEQVICFADKFFSKVHFDHEKSMRDARRSIARYGDRGLRRFNSWYELLLQCLKEN